ncbi:30S ribosomal protein S15 [Candidatus Peribacteria bacterium]|jgi:small subunit ribosomal protein S15|nr:30S ribosomal protein S15 [Candidatus Peribacteria bacterium]MBT4021075.1 30S ribosomal protein S15 [Candidatus Peribacteria bacterium]MBT4240796.1 30S ribosomal protein S15 [Candidatus Peribacteria bacterium]MBT4474175.1 30S ribosomal protein S15 [Candidatus Peribacteria bacterium]
MLTRTDKKKLIGKHQIHEKDTGSSHVQIAILTTEINLLSDHLKEHKKDESARRGLLGKVAQRRKTLNYMKMHETKEYEEVIKKNGLKR